VFSSVNFVVSKGGKGPVAVAQPAVNASATAATRSGTERVFIKRVLDGFAVRLRVTA
jgi:hypothetical protein